MTQINKIKPFTKKNSNPTFQKHQTLIQQYQKTTNDNCFFPKPFEADPLLFETSLSEPFFFFLKLPKAAKTFVLLITTASSFLLPPTIFSLFFNQI
ncbi:hypothetical protein Leryth_022302 [Lithospermum erythrorhizon]|nr:hypothetical protein Leryth_022302 [Lithospermum erythrorhizon]